MPASWIYILASWIYILASSIYILTSSIYILTSWIYILIFCFFPRNMPVFFTKYPSWFFIINVEKKRLIMTDRFMPVAVSKFVMTVDALSNSIWKGEAQKKTFDSYQCPVKVASHKGKDVCTIIKIRDVRVHYYSNGYGEDEVVFENAGHILNRFDAAVHDAICSIYEAGNDVFTEKMVISVLSGTKNYRRHYTEKQISLIAESIKSLRNIRMKIDASGEEIFLKNKAIADPCYKYDGVVLPVEDVTVEIKGHEIHAYKFAYNKGLPLYHYAQRKKQIVITDPALINTPLQFSADSVATARYLYAEIESMYSDKCARHNKILLKTYFDSLIPICSVLEKDVRKKKYDLIEKIEVVLNYWKERSFIEDWCWELDSKGKKRAVLITKSVKKEERHLLGH